MLGFDYKTCLTWVKDRVNPGLWLMGQTEHCLLGARGRPTVLGTSTPTVLHAARREHSRKPDEFFALVERICPGRKLELFARTRRPGWQVWGLETDRFPTEGTA